MDLSLSSKLVLVTGSASGIGKAAAERFLREGATVVINGLFDAEVDAALKHLQAFGTVSGCIADLSTSEGAERLHAFARAIGPIDILVNNVGVFSVQPFVEASDEDWQRYFNINVMSAIRMARLALPDMLERNSGSIVNLSSEAAVKPLPQMVHYSVTKTALLGLTRGLAEICKGTGVRVNSVLPGPTWTEGVASYFEGLAAQKSRPMDEIIDNYFKNDEPTSLIQRFVKPEEVADMIAFVSCMPAANGGAYRVEGGIIRSIL